MESDGTRFPVAYRAVLLAAALLVAWQLLTQLTVLALALLLTVILALPLTAATDALARWHVPRAVGALLTLLGVLAVLVAVLALLVPTFTAQIGQLVDGLPALVERLNRYVGLDGRKAVGLGERLRDLAQGYLDEPLRLLGRVTQVLTTIGAVLGGLLLVLATALYIAIDPRPLQRGLIRLVPPARRERAEHIAGRVRGTWMGWLKGSLVNALLTGALTYGGLSLIGLDLALLFAVVTALLEVVPYLGPILGGLLATLFALTQSLELAVLTLVTYTVIQQAEGNLIIPLVMARAVRLHPAVIAFGVVVTGQLAGLLGILLAVPILAALLVLTQELWVRPREERAEADAAGQPPLARG